MVKGIFILTGFILNVLACISTVETTGIEKIENSKYLIEDLVDIDSEEIKKYPVFYIMKGLNEKNDRISKKIELNKFEQVLDLGIYYNFEYLSNHYKGKIYVNPKSTKDYLKDKIRMVFESIENNTYFDDLNLTSNFSLNNNSISSNWKILDSEKNYIDCTYNNEYFGDAIEWRYTYKLDYENNKYNYFAIIKDMNFIPSTKKSDYRMDEYSDFTSCPNEGLEFISYGPKIKNNANFIEYSINAGRNIVDSNQTNLSSDIYCKYDTLLKSPSIIDHSNLINNKIGIEFDYLFPFDDSGEYYKYNISPSYQTVSFIGRFNKDLGSVTLTNEEDIKIQRDGFWSNLLGVFSRKSNITINY